MKTRPWTIAIEGEVKRPQIIDIDRLLEWFPLEERVYRMRCVEAWSMVIPWVGFSLSDFVKKCEPTSCRTDGGEGKMCGTNLNGDRAVEPGIAGAIDLAHAAGA